MPAAAVAVLAVARGSPRSGAARRVRVGCAAAGVSARRRRGSASASQARHWPTTSSVPSKKAVAAGMALDLAAGGLGNAAGLDQHDGLDRQFMLGGHVAANRLENAAPARACWRRSISCTMTSRSRPPPSTANAAPQPGRSRGWLLPTVSSMSCG